MNTERLRALLAPRGDFVVAWSGGLDSTVLVHLLAHGPLASRMCAVHIDHGLRDDSARDAEFCRAQAAAWGILLEVVAIDVVRRNSVQQQARAQRLAALERVAAHIGTNAIVTAHHADDVVETALLHLARGSGLSGILALREHQTLHGFEYLRPLLGVTRADIAHYAQEHRLTWREDPTNAAHAYTRNRLRHRVVPELTRGYGDAIHATLANLRLDDEALEHLAQRLIEEAVIRSPAIGEVRLRRHVLRRAQDALVVRVLQTLVARWEEASLGSEVLTELLSCLRTEDFDTRRLTGRRCVLTVEPDQITLQRTIGQGTRRLDARSAHPIAISPENPRGRIPWFDGWLSWEPEAPTDTEDERSDVMLVPDDRPLTLAGPRPGARMSVAGLDGSKKVTALLAEAGIAEPHRWNWPCVFDGDRCIWVCGVRQSDAYPDAIRTRRLQWRGDARK